MAGPRWGGVVRPRWTVVFPPLRTGSAYADSPGGPRTAGLRQHPGRSPAGPRAPHAPRPAPRDVVHSERVRPSRPVAPAAWSCVHPRSRASDTAPARHRTNTRVAPIPRRSRTGPQVGDEVIAVVAFLHAFDEVVTEPAENSVPAPTSGTGPATTRSTHARRPPSYRAGRGPCPPPRRPSPAWPPRRRHPRVQSTHGMPDDHGGSSSRSLISSATSSANSSVRHEPRRRARP